MAIPLRFQLLVLFLLLLLISLFISAATATNDAAVVPSASPSSANSPFQSHLSTYPPALFATILSTLGFEELSSAVANVSATTPLTIFAPSDGSLLSCPSCSITVLLQEHSIPGLYPVQFLKSLTFGTKIETLAPNRCLTITHDGKNKVFLNGIEITKPDMFNNGLIVIHGITGFVSHLSPLSCNIERMTSLSFPSPVLSSASGVTKTSSHSLMRLMLKDAVYRLRTTEYSVVSLALRVKFVELSELKSLTIFALDDASIFSGGGNLYLSNFRYHVVPNRRLTAAELVSLAPTTLLQTMQPGNNLVVTTGGGGGPLAPMKINYVKITTIDLMHNSRIVIHGISSPFPHIHHHQAYDESGSGFAEVHSSKCNWSNGICEAEAVVPAGVQSAVDFEDHHGL